MSDARIQEHICDEMQRRMDAYLDDALPAEHAGQLLAHLDHCQGCACEMALRRNIRSRLRSAVLSVALPAFMETRVRAHLRETRRPLIWKLSAATFAAGVLICLSFGLAYQRGHFRSTRPLQESYITSVSNRVARIMRVGLGDHLHCAVFRKYPKNPPPMEQFISDMGPKYSGLIPIVRERVPSEFRVEQAHQCHYHNRGFVHMVLRGDSGLLSILMTEKNHGEAFKTDELLPTLTESGIGIYTSSVQRFQIAGFETRDHLVYVISDLPQRQNMDLMLAMAPSLKSYLSKIES